MAVLEDYGLGNRLKSGFPVTLVLGAGVSRDRGLPLWSDLLRQTWQEAFGNDPYADDIASIERVRSICRQEGLGDLAERLDVKRHPFELQFSFEAIFAELRYQLDDPLLYDRLGLRRRATRPGAPRRSREDEASELFSDLLRKILYRNHERRVRSAATVPDTLSLIAQAVRRSALKLEDRRLITQVITFNVDDLLECEVNAGCRRRIPYAVPIARASAFRPLPVRRAIPIYHIHGFIPMAGSRYPHFTGNGWIDEDHMQARNDSLVFTDEQYWRMVGNPMGFASRVFRAALTGCCVFVGLSMIDTNLIRWLAQDAIERGDDFRRLAGGWRNSLELEFNVVEDLSRHYWITEGKGSRQERPRDRPIANVLRGTLGRRGVQCIDIPSWKSVEFRSWWRDSFLSGRGPRSRKR